MRKRELEEAARELAIARAGFPNRSNKYFDGMEIKPTAEQYRDAEIVLKVVDRMRRKKTNLIKGEGR